MKPLCSFEVDILRSRLAKALRTPEPILDAWQALPPQDFPNRAVGRWGSAAADELLIDYRRGCHGCAVCL